MTPTPKAIENAARAMRDITFDALTMDECRDAAKAALSADLGDLVLVPKKVSLKAILAGLDEYWGPRVSNRLQRPRTQAEIDGMRAAYRAMIAAAEGER